tara:strand:+ start:613 stop:1719 length:1107 start_codon:yes stop_codon:yes gene_type:complete
MDDYSLSSLSESKNEWCARLVNILTPAITEGLRSIYTEAFDLCIQNEEEDKYLMTFQTFLSRIPKWNETMVDDERKRIENSTACTYLEDLITCVHVIQLKALTCVRVGQKQKKIDIDIPSANSFIHKAYVSVARKLYTNIYLFEVDIPPLEIQKRNRELELIVKESILNAIRDTMPVEAILRAYMDETEEQNVIVKEEVISPPEAEPIPEPITEPIPTAITKTQPDVLPTSTDLIKIPPPVSINEAFTPTSNLPNPEIIIKTDSIPENPIAPPTTPSNIPTKLSFGDVDKAMDENGNESEINAPKNIERLEKLAEITAEKRRMEALEDDEDRIQIGDDVNLEISDISNLQTPSIKLTPPVLDDIEVLG